MLRPLLIISLIAVVPILSAQPLKNHGTLKVSPDGHDLVYADGTPFFWLGDTGWDLFFRLTTAEAREYLDNRKSKGFNVIQATMLPMFNLSLTNRYGQHPLAQQEPFQPNEKYFAHVDTIIRMAASRHMIMALVACWVDSRPALDSNAAYVYGTWLAKRYMRYDNIVWIIGGDRPPYTAATNDLPLWRAIATGIKNVSKGRQLLTYHPPGERSSSQWLHQEDWLDFNMMQSSHGRRNMPNWELVQHDRALLPVKPTLDAEPNYEDHPVSPWPTWDSNNGYFRAYDVRKQLYRSVFAGACGVTYGHHAIWQFVSERDEIIIYAERGWRNALDRPGAFQSGYLRRLMQSRPYLNRQPDSTLVDADAFPDSAHITAFRGHDNSYCMIYLPVGDSIRVNMSWLKAATITAWWFNPRDASVQKIDTSKKADEMIFISPTRGSGNDWVLVIDDPSRKYPQPASPLPAQN